MEASRRKQLIIIVGSVVFLIIAISIIWAIISSINTQNKKNTVYITNLSACSKDMRGDVEDTMRGALYDIVKSANDYNKVSTQDNYKGTLRQDTCKEQVLGNESIESEAVIDIPEAKQTWKLSYHWVKRGTSENIDLGSVVSASCVDKSLLKFGDFKCDNIVSLKKYGTDKPDPILEYMPYSGSGFNLAFNSETKEVTATIQLRQSQRNNVTLINNLKGQVSYWFSHRNLDINKYTVLYNYSINGSPAINDPASTATPQYND